MGEELAVGFLQKNGYKIIDRNFRIRGGEIDIIAIDNNTLVYIEVKTRTTNLFGAPEEAVGWHKLNFLKRAVKFYRRMKNPIPVLERIDVVSVDLTDPKIPNIKLIQNVTF